MRYLSTMRDSTFLIMINLFLLTELESCDHLLVVLVQYDLITLLTVIITPPSLLYPICTVFYDKLSKVC